MSENSMFSKDQMKTIAIDKKDWMEELNLPPKLIRFLRENSRELQIGAAVFVLALLAINGFQYYRAKKLETTTAMLAQAMAVQEADARQQALRSVVSEYGSSAAGLWARIELAHQAAKDGDAAEAVSAFSAILAELDDDSSLRPMVLYALAHALEAAGELDQAIGRYQELAGLAGYQQQGLLGVARLHEAKGESEPARNAYQQIVDLGEGDKSAWAEAKLRQLSGPSATVSESTADESATAGGQQE